MTEIQDDLMDSAAGLDWTGDVSRPGDMYTSSTPVSQKRSKVTFASDASGEAECSTKLKEDLDSMTASYESLKEASAGQVPAELHAKLVEERYVLQAAVASLKESYNLALR